MFACGFIGIDIHLDVENTWTKKYDPALQIKGWFTKYVYAFYWAVTTMTTVGLGDINPANIYEIVIYTVFMLISCGQIVSVRNIDTVFDSLYPIFKNDIEQLYFENAIKSPSPNSVPEVINFVGNGYLLKQQQYFNYVGDKDLWTKQRNGVGIFTYQNNYFQYEGQWQNGVKQGEGVLRMKDGTYYEGQFDKGEINGRGKMQYSNGNYYEGEFKFGEKDGYGEFFAKTGEIYKGEWQNNIRHGKGIIIKYRYVIIFLLQKGYLIMGDGETIDGYFFNHNPHGKCEITYSNGNKYKGEMKNGKKDGQGIFENNEEQYIYEGEFKENKKNGKGKFIFLKSNFIYEGIFAEDVPQLVSNIFIIEESKLKTEQEINNEVIENNRNDKKKDDKNKNPEDSLPCIEYEICGKPITINIFTAYQGPDILDPQQPKQEQIEEMIKQWQKDNKKIKNPPPMPDFNQPKMMQPPPALIIQNINGVATIENLEFPEDFPPGKYQIVVLDYSKKNKFGDVLEARHYININGIGGVGIDNKKKKK
ncbi:MORN repeat protein [Ichthyophthirius multifiliis]|uniref:MORN repeat protein n=1 Tax=Ichthyophthirius multifiliis TaxID=5932 RepID=G0R433_ICHMU|nr:MORN repeat protein [Ichthyophthirius multifiliis]EGR27773.1 MORN repeat protein [Ichthyophthirius multifiliis]|eukprot:XP_004026840.1 MORN repeat protein [Ichthyophthirius multifiliis]